MNYESFLQDYEKCLIIVFKYLSLIGTEPWRYSTSFRENGKEKNHCNILGLHSIASLQNAISGIKLKVWSEKYSSWKFTTKWFNERLDNALKLALAFEGAIKYTLRSHFNNYDVIKFQSFLIYSHGSGSGLEMWLESGQAKLSAKHSATCPERD